MSRGRRRRISTARRVYTFFNLRLHRTSRSVCTVHGESQGGKETPRPGLRAGVAVLTHWRERRGGVMPFKSQAQRRKFAELLVQGKISPQTFEEWNRETGGRKLPQRVKRAKKKTATGRKRR